MSNVPFVIERTYNAPVAKVWKAITDKDQMKQWYFDLSAFEARPGFRFSFPGQGHKGEQYIHHCEVREAIPNKKLSYSWAYEHYEGSSVVTFELFEEGSQTRLRLTHEGLETFPKHPDFAPESFAAGWTELIGKNLKTFVEGA
ncbi:MAG TPA: SRPBCC domain-containing protein [Puia sp.]|uniref:SRPBCC family protein n=1 Tax=Taibaiella helva TaxID=2301235 RepID=UPI000E597C50|nr:SRPBCC domain-containing protein [Taibaiella helva]